MGLNDDPRERAFAQQLSFGTVQCARRLDYVIGSLGKRPLRKLDPQVLHALRIGVFELLELQQATDEDGRRLGSTSAHAAIDQAVEIVRGSIGERAVAFTNAVLRRAQVDGQSIIDGLDPSDDDDLATILSMPQWLVKQVKGSHGDKGIEALRAMNEPRLSAFRERSTGEAIVVEGNTAHLSERIEQGEIVPQSLASQLVVHKLDPRPGERILDMCAAPGGKTTFIADLVGADGHVIGVELHEHRARSIKALATRLGLLDRIEVRVGDAVRLDAETLGGVFDRVLLDAPCSGTGVLGVRPDARWKRTEEAVRELVILQGKLLDRAATLVRVGGILVYATCSILVEENESLIATRPECLELLSEHRTWPQDDDTDGFYIAIMQRKD